ncbi:hypothetical protein BJV82DRAFT_579352 [Fennellomyces sp. T-0311]|nr:hypothetical protein BJV82DRAFT_579352 [Fennellomyces sp. T-0311]
MARWASNCGTHDDDKALPVYNKSRRVGHGRYMELLIQLSRVPVETRTSAPGSIKSHWSRCRIQEGRPRPLYGTSNGVREAFCKTATAQYSCLACLWKPTPALLGASSLTGPAAVSWRVGHGRCMELLTVCVRHSVKQQRSVQLSRVPVETRTSVPGSIKSHWSRCRIQEGRPRPLYGTSNGVREAFCKTATLSTVVLRACGNPHQRSREHQVSLVPLPYPGGSATAVVWNF